MDEVALLEAADIFNATRYRRTVGGIAKSLGDAARASIVALSGVDRRDGGHGRVGHLLVPVPRHAGLRPAGPARAARPRARRARGGFKDWNAHIDDEGRLVPRSPGSSWVDLRRRPTIRQAMIYCVIPRELESELYDKMVEYYEDNPNVTVIVDRREGPDRRRGKDAGRKRG